MREIVAIWYRGATYQLGRGRDFYGIWPAGVPGSQPFERWPLTTEGWYGAWSRFAAIEAPGTIVPAVQHGAAAAGRPDPAAAQDGAGTAGRRSAPADGRNWRPATAAGTTSAAGTDPGGESADWRPASAAGATAAGTGPRNGSGDSPDWRPAGAAGSTLADGPQGSEPEAGADARPADAGGLDLLTGPAWRSGTVTGTDVPTAPGLVTGARPATVAGRHPRAPIAAALLAVGVACGIAGLFPGYIGGASLAQEADLLVPHILYLAVWGASAVLILLGGARLRAGALLGTGLSIVTFGFFFADAGTVIAGGTQLMGAGLVLSLIGWLACAAGSVLAFRLAAAGRPARLRPRGIESVLMLTLAGLGAAVAFVPSWDSYTLRTPGGVTQTLTAGYAFANPGAVIAGNIAVMVGLVAVAVAAAVWRPRLLGAALLAGAIVPMAAQAISALILVGQGASPAQFGIPAAQAAQARLTISSGLTPAFWIYCAFVVVLAALCARMIYRSRPAPDAVTPPRSVGLDVSPPATSTFS